MNVKQENRPSLEHLLESEALGLEVFHPGGLDITHELGELCHIVFGSNVLDVASGTGESACYLAERFRCRVIGVDASDFMIRRATEKARSRHLPVEFRTADAHALPFDTNSFDAVLSECTVSLLNKAKAIGEMRRVAKRGGYVGIHDLCWKKGTPEHMKQRLAAIEREWPETLRGWERLFERVGLTDVIAVDKSGLIAAWIKEMKQKLGVMGQWRIFLKVIKRWGIGGYRSLRASEQVFRSEHTGYGIIVGRKP